MPSMPNTTHNEPSRFPPFPPGPQWIEMRHGPVSDEPPFPTCSDHVRLDCRPLWARISRALHRFAPIVPRRGEAYLGSHQGRWGTLASKGHCPHNFVAPYHSTSTVSLTIPRARRAARGESVQQTILKRSRPHKMVTVAIQSEDELHAEPHCLRCLLWIVDAP